MSYIQRITTHNRRFRDAFELTQQVIGAFTYKGQPIPVSCDFDISEVGEDDFDESYIEIGNLVTLNPDIKIESNMEVVVWQVMFLKIYPRDAEGNQPEADWKQVGEFDTIDDALLAVLGVYVTKSIEAARPAPKLDWDPFAERYGS